MIGCCRACDADVPNDLGNIAIPKSARLASRVVHRECDPKGGLRIASGYRRIVVRSEDATECLNIGAGVEYGIPRQAKPAHVTGVDLSKPEIDGVSCRNISLRSLGSSSSTILSRGLPLTIHVKREWLPIAFGSNYRKDGFRRHSGSALHRECQQGGR